jgi:hypothetical protein
VRFTFRFTYIRHVARVLVVTAGLGSFALARQSFGESAGLRRRLAAADATGGIAASTGVGCIASIAGPTGFVVLIVLANTVAACLLVVAWLRRRRGMPGFPWISPSTNT